MIVLRAGAQVVLPKGTPIVYDTAPGEKRSVVGRRQIVTVAWMTHHPDTIYWAGAGGYWKGARLTDEMAVMNPAKNPSRDA